ncbi:hypothetical protein B7494_g7082 [Chlorociboria aeruginascens]|nr:hypothetical protein B7494_g7082 [Chlorociboria aeruginascens]
MNSTGETLSLIDLPDEVLQHIFYYFSPEDTLLNVDHISKRFNRLSNEPLLWRYHCRVQFRYWDSNHRIRQKFAGNVGDVDWKTLFLYRQQVDLQTTRTLDSILEGQIDRIGKFEEISKFGYDAKDTLLRHCHTSSEADDALARKYYANAVLDHVHRSKALAEWWKLGRGEGIISLERVLGSFDLFVLHDQPGDLVEISEILDELAARARIEYSNIEYLSARKKALAIATFLRAHNMTGIATELAYHDLQNSYIGIGLQADDHPSSPLISVAIFCAVAKRLGLDARCCGLTNHVYAMVYAQPFQDLDGKPLIEGDVPPAPMYLDPYRLNSEIPIEHLRSILAAWGIHPLEFPSFLSESTPTDLVLRTSRNILATIQEFRGHGGDRDNTEHPTVRLYANPLADMDNAFYSALWANFLLSPSVPSLDGPTQRQFIPPILERFERVYTMDASLIEQYICPPFNNSASSEHWELYEVLRKIRTADSTPRKLKSRVLDRARDKVKYKVGQVFRHKRYGFIAVIIGWDAECGMNSEWVAHHDVDAFPGGGHQIFYHALVEDTSMRYVAEENLEIIKPEVPISLMSLAGRYFKRWDWERHMFVSNIRDEYPDD